jgi:hypothetical protein
MKRAPLVNGHLKHHIYLSCVRYLLSVCLSAQIISYCWDFKNMPGSEALSIMNHFCVLSATQNYCWLTANGLNTKYI